MIRFLCLSLPVALVFMAAPVLAEVTMGTWYLEGGTGYFFGDSDSEVKADTEIIVTDPGPPPVEVETKYKIEAEAKIENGYPINFRVGRFFSKHWGVESLLWFFPTELTGSVGVDGVAVTAGTGEARPYGKGFTDSVEVDMAGFDGSVVYCPNPSRKINFLLLGGLGLMSTELFEGSRGTGAFTLHVGAAAKIFLTDRLYIRPDVRYLSVGESIRCCPFRYINSIDLDFDVYGLDSIERAKEYLEDESDFDISGPGFDFDETHSLNFTTATVSIGWVFGK